MDDKKKESSTKTKIFAKSSGKWRSDWSRDIDIFERLNKIQEIMDIFAIKILLYDLNSLEYLQNYYGHLYTFFINLSPGMDGEFEDAFDKEFEEVQQQIIKSKKNRHGTEIDITAHKSLLTLHRNLLYAMQLLGLGIKMSKHISEESRLKKAMGL